MTHQRPAVVQLGDGEEGFTRLGYEPLGEHPECGGQVMSEDNMIKYLMNLQMENIQMPPTMMSTMSWDCQLEIRGSSIVCSV